MAFRPLAEIIELDKLKKEPSEEIIEMDLKRSVRYFDEKDHDSIKTVLLNVSYNFDKIGYYQGMNYIAIFCFEAFGKDLDKTFRFIGYLASRFLIGNFSNEAGGLMRLLWTTDRMLEATAPSLWEKMRIAKLSAMHFATPNVLTLLTCLIKEKEAVSLVYDIFDLTLAEGIEFTYHTLIYLLDVQKAYIINVDEDELMLAVKNVDSDPFAILRCAGLKDQVVEKCFSHLNKKNLRQIDYDRKVFPFLDAFYEKFVKQNQEFWG